MTPLNWLRTHRFEAHVIAFLLMITPPIPMILFARQGATVWIWPLLGLIVLGNLLELALK